MSFSFFILVGGNWNGDNTASECGVGSGGGGWDNRVFCSERDEHVEEHSSMLPLFWTNPFDPKPSASNEIPAKSWNISMITWTYFQNEPESKWRINQTLLSNNIHHKQCKPTLAMEMVCCSITSWMAVRSPSIILSNSSMQQTPRSANTSAPPSSIISPVTGSFITAAVRPTPEEPLPVVYWPEKKHTNESNFRPVQPPKASE